MALLRSPAKPLHRLGIVLGHSLPLVVHVPEIELSGGMALLRSLAKPLHRLGIVLGHSLPLAVHESEIALSGSIALIRSPAKPLHPLGIVLGHSLPLVVHEPEIELSRGPALLGMHPEPAIGRGVVATLMCSHGLLEGLRRRWKRAHCHEQKRYGRNTQAGCPSRFHVDTLSFPHHRRSAQSVSTDPRPGKHRVRRGTAAPRCGQLRCPSSRGAGSGLAGQLTPTPPNPQYPHGFLARYCWW